MSWMVCRALGRPTRRPDVAPGGHFAIAQPVRGGMGLQDRGGAPATFGHGVTAAAAPSCPE